MAIQLDIIVIGASAGGWKTLGQLFRGFSPDLDASVFVALHMKNKGPSFLAEMIAAEGPIPAELAQDGEKFTKGKVYVAPPGFQLEIDGSRIRLSEPGAEDPFCPSIDLLFKSAAKKGQRVAGVILTGMLDDGAEGLAEIHKHGGVTIVQQPSEAFISAMPNAAIQKTHVDYVLPIAEISKILTRLTRSG